MGSLEEEKLVQMVDDFIESAKTPTPCSSTSSNSLSLSSKTNYFFRLKEILGSGEKLAEGEVGEAVMKHLRRKRDAPKTTSLKKWLVMKLKMDGYDSSDLCHTSWVTSMGCPAGDYEYIEMKVEDELNGREMRVIIDIDFKAQFEVARATAEYKQLIEALPSVFVGTEEKVLRIISILCSAAKLSLRESGLHIPPWRTSTYMHCKWLSPHQQRQQTQTQTPTNNNNHNNNNFEMITQKEKLDLGFNKWNPPMVKQIKRRVWSGASALSSQFSNMSINCC